MASKEQNKQSKKLNKKALAASVAWLVEASFRGIVGWIILSNFDHPLAVAAALYSLATCGVIVAKHFVDSHKYQAA